MILTTASNIEKYRIIQYLGLVNGAADYNVVGLLGEAILKQPTLYKDSVEIVQSQIEYSAKKLGADAVVGIHITTSLSGARVIVTGTGTAVKIKKVGLEDELSEQKVHSYSCEINSNASTDALMTRVLMLLEDGEWENVKRYCYFILDADPMNANAYLSLFMADQKIDSPEKLKELKQPFDEDRNYQRFLQFATPEVREPIEAYNEAIKNEIAERSRIRLSIDNDTDVQEQTESAKKIVICPNCKCYLSEMGFDEDELEKMTICPVCGESLL